MKIGDEIQIAGWFGFLLNPTLRILDVKENLALVQSIEAKEGGSMYHLTKSWVNADMLEKRRVYPQV